MRLFLMLCIACVCVVLTGNAAQSREVDCTYVTVTLPDNWEVVREPGKDDSGLFYVIFGNKEKPTSVILMSGPSDGKPVGEIAALLGDSVGATEEPAVRDNQCGYPVNNGQEGFCVVTANKERFLMTCFYGDAETAMKVLETIKSDKYPELVPK